MGSGEGRARRPGRGLRIVTLRHWRVRSKLFAVVVIPTVAFAALAGVGVAASLRHEVALDTTTGLARAERQATALSHELQLERDLTAGRIAAGRTVISVATRLDRQREATDASVAAWRAATEALTKRVGGKLRRSLETVRGDLDALPVLRRTADAAGLSGPAVLGGYSRVIAALIDVGGAVAQPGSSDDLVRSVHAFADLAQVKEEMSQVRAALYGVAYRRNFGFGGFQDFTGLQARRQAALVQFRADASESQRAQYAEVVKGPAVLTVAGIEQTAARRQAAATLDVDPEQWLAASTTEIELMRDAETDMLDRIIARSESLETSNDRRIAINGIVSAVVLTLALLMSFAVARSMARHLNRLRHSALEVAEERLPEVIARLSTATEAVPAEAVAPLRGIGGRDEIGDVARAFDDVHRQAIRLATEQAVLRRGVNTMFVNLARRSQVLVSRQLRLIDELEKHEQDPEALQGLFQLDHLATRMRRNDESLLVLAGSDTPRSWTEAIGLTDVVRAAISEVEHFTRIRLSHVSDVAILGHAVADVVHLLAELLENATTFSPPSSMVVLTGRAIRAGTVVLVEVEDVGVGMTPADLAEANQHLAEPPVTDLAFSERMGLFVVSRLASRHGITVRLRESPHGGIIASVTIPAAVLGSPARAGSLRAGAGTMSGFAVTEAAELDTGELVVAGGGPAAFDGRAMAGTAAGGPTLTPAPAPSLGSVSAWFSDGTGGHADDLAAAGARTRRTAAEGGSGAWGSPADEGWAKAAKAGDAPAATLTGSGLPIRVPRANYVPGSAGRLGPPPQIEEEPAAEAEERRSVLSNLYRGVEQARDADVGTLPDPPPDSSSTPEPSLTPAPAQPADNQEIT